MEQFVRGWRVQRPHNGYDIILCRAVATIVVSGRPSSLFYSQCIFPALISTIYVDSVPYFNHTSPLAISAGQQMMGTKPQASEISWFNDHTQWINA